MSYLPVRRRLPERGGRGLRVTHRGMGNSVAAQVALARVHPEGAELQSMSNGVRQDDVGGEVDEAAVVDEVALVRGDPVGIVAGCARCSLVHDVFFVEGERGITQEVDAIVALVAQRVAADTF